MHETRIGPIRTLLTVVATATLFIIGSEARARALDDIRVSRSGSEATVEIEFGCGMRLLDQRVYNGGSRLQVRLAIGQDCRLTLRNVHNEVRRPAAGRMAALAEISLDVVSLSEATVTLTFDEAVRALARQTGNLYMLTVFVDTEGDAVDAPPQPEPQSDAAPALQPPPTIGRPARRVPSDAQRNRNRFAIRVTVLDDETSIDADTLDALQTYTIYATDVQVDDRRWAELRVGFFDTEAEADSVLRLVGKEFDAAFITVANPFEQERALEQRFDRELLAAPDRAAAPAVASAAVTRAEASLSEREVISMMTDAREALLRQDFAASIQHYRRLLEEPLGAHRRAAREFLGVAYEKSGRIDNARAEYTAYLEEYPGDADAARVRQRLAALTVAPRGPEAPPARPTAEPDGWEIFGAASQYYLRGVNLAVGDEPDLVGQSALFSQAQLIARRQGARFDLETRINASFLYDFGDTDTENQGLVSYAYLDVTDNGTGFGGRIGRQRQQSAGALGRFDGIHIGYGLRRNLKLNVTAGFPVDSPRFLPTTDHYFYGVSADVDNVADLLDLSAFATEQRIDGILDRRAVGAEAQYHRDDINLVGLIDYDTSFNVINTALVTGNWRLHDRLTIYGQARGGAAPFLTTRNAIIGQPVNTVRELFPSFSTGQIRRLARNRTSDERAASAGLSAALTARLQLEVDVSYLEYAATVASGGVPAYPGTGPQYTWGGQLIGSGFVSPSHLFVLGYRHDEAQSVDGDTVWLDLRLPIGERLRLQTRLEVGLRVANQDPAGDIEQWIGRPRLRLLYVSSRRFRLDLEVGGQWSNRDFPQPLTPPGLTENHIEESSYFVQLGYQLDF